MQHLAKEYSRKDVPNSYADFKSGTFYCTKKYFISVYMIEPLICSA